MTKAELETKLEETEAELEALRSESKAAKVDPDETASALIQALRRRSVPVDRTLERTLRLCVAEIHAASADQSKTAPTA